MILGYFEDGSEPDHIGDERLGRRRTGVVTLNLQAHPIASVDLADGRRAVKGRAAEGEERSRLRARWKDIDTNLDGYAALRSGETAVVVLEPWSEPIR